MRRITLRECEAEGACTIGLEWARRQFKGRSFTIVDVVRAGKFNYAVWLLHRFYYEWVEVKWDKMADRISANCPAAKSALMGCTCHTEKPAAFIKLLQRIDP